MAKVVITIEDTSDDTISMGVMFEPTLVRPESGVWEDIADSLTIAQQSGIAAVQWLRDELELEGGVVTGTKADGTRVGGD